MNVPSFFTSSFILLKMVYTVSALAVCNSNWRCDLMLYTPFFAFWKEATIKKKQQSTLMSVFVLLSRAVFGFHSLPAQWWTIFTFTGHAIEVMSRSIWSHVIAKGSCWYLYTKCFWEPPDATSRPWNCRTDKMYVHMFTCKNKPWLAHSLGALPQ